MCNYSWISSKQLWKWFYGISCCCYIFLVVMYVSCYVNVSLQYCLYLFIFKEIMKLFFRLQKSLTDSKQIHYDVICHELLVKLSSLLCLFSHRTFSALPWSNSLCLVFTCCYNRHTAVSLQTLLSQFM